MSDRANHRRVLHFAVTGVLLGGALGCTSNEPAKADAKADEKSKAEPKALPPVPEHDMKFAPNPGPNELKGLEQPEVAPTTAVKPEPIEDIDVNEGPVKEPVPVPVPEKRVNTGPVKEPPPEPKPLIKVNPGPEG